MSQSKTPCPHCKRPVGDQHRAGCARSPELRAYLDTTLRRVPSYVWLFGDNMFLKPKKDGSPGRSIMEAWNPGVPCVRRNRRNWMAGGIPHEFRPEALAFAKALRLAG